ncbi:hypothetical protein MMPV_007106 [Pyropia vietnamensis]
MPAVHTLMAAAAAAAATLVVAVTSLSTASAAASCGANDDVCWNAEALRLTNDVRVRHGRGRVPPLAPGIKPALANARYHAEAMAVRLGLVHQDLRDAARSIGCGVFVSGENIAYASANYPGADNPAAMCVDMWERSPPHLANILAVRNKEMVFGFYSSPTKGVWCTQTFQTGAGSHEQPDCGTAGTGGGGGGGGMPSPPSLPQRRPQQPRARWLAEQATSQAVASPLWSSTHARVAAAVAAAGESPPPPQAHPGVAPMAAGPASTAARPMEASAGAPDVAPARRAAGGMAPAEGYR